MFNHVLSRDLNLSQDTESKYYNKNPFQTIIGSPVTFSLEKNKIYSPSTNHSDLEERVSQYYEWQKSRKSDKLLRERGETKLDLLVGEIDSVSPVYLFKSDECSIKLRAGGKPFGGLISTLVEGQACLDVPDKCYCIAVEIPGCEEETFDYVLPTDKWVHLTFVAKKQQKFPPFFDPSQTYQRKMSSNLGAYEDHLRQMQSHKQLKIDKSNNSNVKSQDLADGVVHGIYNNYDQNYDYCWQN